MRETGRSGEWEQYVQMGALLAALGIPMLDSLRTNNTGVDRSASVAKAPAKKASIDMGRLKDTLRLDEMTKLATKYKKMMDEGKMTKDEAKAGFLKELEQFRLATSDIKLNFDRAPGGDSN